MKGTQDITLYLMLAFIFISFSFLLITPEHPSSMVTLSIPNVYIYIYVQSPCDKINKYVPNLKLNCDDLHLDKPQSQLDFDIWNTKEVKDKERVKLLNFIKSLEKN